LGAEALPVGIDAVLLPFPLKNIFINHRHAHSGMVFDDGEIVEW
jgi:hypothetical protein